ncbi:MAG: 30S ribosomal protein S6 [Clostridiales bacterium]|nr:30S ribosomal protein S6 [Clostridiales bacterium]MCD7827420.1 30S ribosomal protein S6 [Clostridiales bacterium]
MAKTNYEAVLIFSVKDGDDVSALVEKFKALIEANGTLTSVDEWGKRRLAYPINYETEGYYVLYNFEAEPDFPAEFERIANITDRTIRSMVVKAQAPVQVKEPVSDADEDAADAPAEEAAE